MDTVRDSMAPTYVTEIPLLILLVALKTHGWRTRAASIFLFSTAIRLPSSDICYTTGCVLKIGLGTYLPRTQALLVKAGRD
jgi:hypothetical protein